jgi:hypothetical protein
MAPVEHKIVVESRTALWRVKAETNERMHNPPIWTPYQKPCGAPAQVLFGERGKNDRKKQRIVTN